MKNVIAAVQSEEEFDKALNSSVDTIFDLSPNIMSLKDRTDKAHSVNKKIFIHIDLAEGIGKDKFGLLHAKEKGIDGVISTRTALIKSAKEIGLKTVQRFFIVDSKSVGTTIKALNASKPDMVEILPGIIDKVISKLQKEVDLPIIAGGLIETKDEVKRAYDSGAIAISTGKSDLWN